MNLVKIYIIILFVIICLNQADKTQLIAASDDIYRQYTPHHFLYFINIIGTSESIIITSITSLSTQNLSILSMDNGLINLDRMEKLLYCTALGDVLMCYR